MCRKEILTENLFFVHIKMSRPKVDSSLFGPPLTLFFFEEEESLKGGHRVKMPQISFPALLATGPSAESSAETPGVFFKEKIKYFFINIFE